MNIARKLCERIYKDSQYDWNKILELNRKQIKEMVDFKVTVVK